MTMRATILDIKSVLAPSASRVVRSEWAILVAILLVAAVLRLAALGDVPPGLGYDELQDARLSEHILAGKWAIYFPDNSGTEPLYPALGAFSVRLLGWSVIALRLPAALLGILAVWALYLAARELAGRRVALLAAAFQAVSFWPLIGTRPALEDSLLPPMAALACLFLARGLKQPGGGWRVWLNFAMGGLWLGSQVYAYTAGRVMPFFPLALILYLLLLDRRTLRLHAPRLVTLLVIAVLVAAPMAFVLYTHPEIEQRLDQLSSPLAALRQGDPQPLLQIALGTLGMFTLRGEPQWLYNIAGRPIFDPFTSLFFYVGLMLCLARLRDWRCGLALLWMVVGLLPALVSPPPASFNHALVAQPAVYLMLALGTGAVWEQLNRRWARVELLLAALLLALNLALSSRDFFVVWAHAPQVQELYQGSIGRVAHELDAHDSPGPVAIGAPYIDYWNPWNAVGFDLALRRRDLSVRWFNPAGGWVWPAGSGPTTFYFPHDPLGAQSFDPELQELFAADAVPLPSPSGDFTVFRVARPAALEARLAKFADASLAWPPELSHLPRPAVPLAFGNHLALVGVDLQTATSAPGGKLRLVTYWQVQTADPAPLVAFIHLTSKGQDIWGQQDWLDVRPASLLPGDRFAQVHTVPVKAETPPGLYHVELGLYAPDTLVRLPITSVGGGMADRVWVGEVQVTAKSTP